MKIEAEAGDGVPEDYVDTSNYEVLKELYQGEFKMGVACEAISHWGGTNLLSEIGNVYKEELIKRQFNNNNNKSWHMPAFII